MPPTFESLSAAFQARSPIDIDGTPFTFALTGFRESLPHEVEAIHVAFSAVNAGARHNGELHLGKERYSEEEIAVLAINTIHAIASGELPPGTNQLL
jgi:hypothetical protein